MSSSSSWPFYAKKNRIHNFVLNGLNIPICTNIQWYTLWVYRCVRNVSINENVCNEIKKPESREDECIAYAIYLSHLTYLIFKLSRKCIANGVLMSYSLACSGHRCAHTHTHIYIEVHPLFLYRTHYIYYYCQYICIYLKRYNRAALYIL